MKSEKLAYAKINLTLEIGDKRADGYHSLTSVMARVSLADKVSVATNDDGIIRFTATDKSIPSDDNLCTRAARAYLEAKGIVAQGVDIALENNIPTASGMGGGSADAAATIECLEELFGELDKETRYKIAVSLGADVPFCFEKTPCLCTGIGDRCEKIACADLSSISLVISKVGEKLSTAKVYSDFDALEKSEREYDHTAVINALKSGDIHALANGVFNDFERVVFPSSPEVAEERVRLLSEGALAVVLSGAGPTLVGIFDKKLDGVSFGLKPKMKTFSFIM